MRYSTLYLNVFPIKEFMSSKTINSKIMLVQPPRSGKLGKSSDVDSQLLKQMSGKMGNPD